MTRIRALITKEFLDLRRNRAALLPVGLITIIALMMPFTLAIVVPSMTGRALSEDSDLVKVSRLVAAADLADEARIQLFLFQQFQTFFLLLPITGAMALAAHSVVGEKQARTLEPLLATPVTTFELLVAKVLGALLPTLAISTVGLLAYFGGIAALAAPGVIGALMNARTALLILLVGPMAALVALQAAIVISSRVNDARTAQQFGVLIVLPLSALLVAQFVGAVWFTAAMLALIALGLFGVWLLLTLLSVVIFERESILTRWR